MNTSPLCQDQQNKQDSDDEEQEDMSSQKRPPTDDPIEANAGQSRKKKSRKTQDATSTAEKLNNESDDHKKVESFPEKLMEIMQRNEYNDAIWWLPKQERSTLDAFAIHKEKLEQTVLKTYFRGNKVNSFIRILHKWGFKKATSVSPYQGNKPSGVVAFYHHLFQKDFPDLVKQIAVADSPLAGPTAEEAGGSLESLVIRRNTEIAHASVSQKQQPADVTYHSDQNKKRSPEEHQLVVQQHQELLLRQRKAAEDQLTLSNLNRLLQMRNQQQQAMYGFIPDVNSITDPTSIQRIHPASLSHLNNIGAFGQPDPNINQSTGHASLASSLTNLSTARVSAVNNDAHIAGLLNTLLVPCAFPNLRSSPSSSFSSATQLASMMLAERQQEQLAASLSTSGQMASQQVDWTRRGQQSANDEPTETRKGRESPSDHGKER